MEAFLARLGNLCWWTSWAISMAVFWVFIAVGISSGFTMREWIYGYLVTLVITLPINLVGLGLRYLFAGKLFA